MQRFLVLTLAFSCWITTAMTQPTITYTLGMSRPATHLLDVEVLIERLPDAERQVSFVMPAWRTGRYVLFDFAGGVTTFQADNGSGKALAWSKTDKSTWVVETQGARSVRVRYEVYANEIGQRTRGLNDEHAFVDPATVFMYVDRFSHLPLTVVVRPYGTWRVTTGLEAVPGRPNTFSAPDYQYVADCPIEVGTHHVFTFDAGGTPHELMIAGEGNWDAQRMVRDLGRLVEVNKTFWGKLPYRRYVFMLHVSPQGGGGTEHLNSTIMQMRPYGFKSPEGYRGFLGLASHEYFHTWNVKQLRPSGIHPYDFTKENYVCELWIAEGTTSYYGGLLLVRAGFTTADQYIAGLPANVQGDRMRPGNRLQSPNDASFDAWIKYWRNTPQGFNTETDYYDRGSDVSLILDLEIRHRSEGNHSLDDVMRAMFERFPLGTKGYTVDDFERVCSEFAGTSMRSFFADYVEGTRPLPWEQVLAYAGLNLLPRESDGKPWLGVQTNDVNGAARVVRVIAGSPAYAAGIDLNDEIVALNGVRITSGGLPIRIGDMNAGDTVRVTVFREDRLRDLRAVLTLPPVPSYRVEKAASPTALQKRIFESWLRTED